MLERAGVAPEEIGQIVGGVVTQAGEQSNNVARNAWLHAGLPYTTAATTIDCACGSSQQAVHMVAGLIASGQIDAGIGRVESMSRVFLGQALAPATVSRSPRTGPSTWATSSPPAERIAANRGIKRGDTDAFGLRVAASRGTAWAEGRFDREIVPVEAPVVTKEGELTGEVATVDP